MKSFLQRSAFVSASALILLAGWQCSQPTEWEDPADSTPPGPVSGVKITNVNGGAIVEFTPPEAEDLMGVKALYRPNESDTPREIWASAQSDTILLDGYGDTREHRVELYAVDESGNLSTPVEAVIRPLEPAIESIRRTLDVRATFSGVRTAWKNPLKKPINITLYTLDASGEKVVFDRYFSSGAEDAYTFRQLEAEEQPFHIELSDRWGNTAPAMDTLLTPLYETQILGRENNIDVWSLYGFNDNTNKFRGDVFEAGGSSKTFATPFNRTIDGVWDNGSSDYWYVRPLFMSNWIPGKSSIALYPQHFTLDMGRPAAYSRLKIWTRNRTPIYSAWVWYEFEVWGTNEVKPVTGDIEEDLRYWTSWEEIGGTDQWKEGWEKLCDCSITFPSGTPNSSPSVTSVDDVAFVRNGFEFPVDDAMTAKPFRYLRFVLKKQNVQETYIQWGELQFFGAYAD